MAPVLRALSHTKGVESIVCITGQHRYMLEQVLTLFEIRADHDLDVMVEGQTLNGLSARILERLDPVLDHVRPQRVLVHGDTSTAMAAALAAFHRKIPVGHVEAGLRTGSLAEPWPEEFNRRMVDVIGDYLFAPTEQARDNLLAERLSGQIHVTGNTVIDALQVVAASSTSTRRCANRSTGGCPGSRRMRGWCWSPAIAAKTSEKVWRTSARL